MKKRMFAMLLALCMIVSLLPFGAAAADIVASGECGAEGDNVTWTLDSERVLTISGTGEMRDYSYDETPFRNKDFQSVVIEPGVTSIGSCVFHVCYASNITIADSVTDIHDHAFWYCMSLRSIEIPDSVTSIGESAFYNCKDLTSVKLSDSVTSISAYTFSGCTSLTSVEIPDSVTTIDEYAFQNCTSLTGIDIPDSVTSIGDNAFSGCSSLTGITIPDSVTSIGYGAFSSCSSLTSIEIPDSVTNINGGYFSSCTSLTSVKLPNGLTSIPTSMFNRCSSLTSFEIPDSVTSIGDHAFSWCSSLTSVDIPDSVTSIGNSAFEYCTSLTSIKIPDGVTSIDGYTFQDCTSLTSIKIPSSVTSISGMAFHWCTSLASVEILEGATSIGFFAFGGCTSLTSIKIPNSVTSISDVAFYMCSSLKDVFYHGTQEEWDAITIEGHDDVSLKPDESLTAATLHLEPHDFQNWTPVQAVTCTKSGTETGTCTICGKTESREIPALGHDYESIVTRPTCTERGYTTHTCSRCGDSFVDTYVDALGHAYSEWALTTEPTCTEPGEETRVCAHDLSHIESRPVNALGHDWGEWEVVTPATEETDGVQKHSCARCGETETGVIPSVGHQHSYTPVVTEPTCTERGYTTKVCRCGDSYVDETSYVDALGHDWGEWETVTPATEDADGVKEHTCSRCGATETGVIPSLGHQHHYEAVVTPATCTERGYTTYTCKCGDSYKGDYVDALGHDWGGWMVTKAATATERGVETRTCKNDPSHKETREIPALSEGIPEEQRFTGCVGSPISLSLRTNHETTYSISEGMNSAIKFVETGHSSIVMGGYGIYVYGYDFTASKPGRYIVSIRDDQTGDVLQCMFTITEHDWGPWKVTKAASTEPGEEQRVCKNNEDHVQTRVIPATEKKNPFTDVKKGDYFFDPVLWALNHNPQITDGTSDTTFSPGATCTRGQVVTFLWRAMGCAEPTNQNNPFSDVKPSDYFYKAVLWAVEKGITDGTSATTFSPADPCTRAHVVTFLWRAENKPAAGSNNPFRDVAHGQYYTDAVLWAVEKGITDGTSDTTFSPNDPCTRGQIVTFLYRDMK